MPLYDYQCRTCSKVTEVRHGFREAYDGSCPDCGGSLARVFNPAGIVFKGSGFYVTDSRKPSSDGGSSKPSETSKTSESKSSDASASGGSSSATPSTGSSGSTKSESTAA